MSVTTVSTSFQKSQSIFFSKKNQLSSVFLSDLPVVYLDFTKQYSRRQFEGNSDAVGEIAIVIGWGIFSGEG